MMRSFGKCAEDGDHYITGLSANLGAPDNHERTERVLIAVLNALRKILSPADNLQFMAQLPMFLRIFYMDGYTPWDNKQKPGNIDEFLRIVKNHCGRFAMVDFKNDAELEDVVKTVLYSLRNYVSVGDMEDIIAHIPREIKQLISNSVKGREAFDSFV